MGAAHREAHSKRISRLESEAHFRAFMDHSPTVAYLKDSSSRMLYVNDAYCKVFRIRPEQHLGKLQSEVMPLAVAEQLRANDKKVIESQCAYQFEESIPDQSGPVRHWLSFKFPVMGRSGEVFLGGVSVEVTDMVRAQNALRESESRYRQIVEYAGDIIVRCDATGRITYINEMGARVLRIPAGQMLGRRALRLVRPDARRRARSDMWRELARGASDLYLEVPVAAGDGSELWLGETIRVLRNGDSVQGFEAICRDITDRRRMEAGLRASEERFRLLYENGPVAYHAINREGVIQRVNRAECEMLGYSEGELVGHSVLDLLAPEDRETARAAIRAKVNQELPLRPFNRIYLRPDGHRVRVEIHENLIRDHHGEVSGIHSVLLDVTQRHLAETLDHDRRELSEMIAQQQPLCRILSGIAAMISHQDEGLLCIPLRLDEAQLEAVWGDSNAQQLCGVIGELGSQALSIWPANGFRVSHLNITGLSGNQIFGEFAAAAARLGMESCWSIPIISSSRQSLGLLLVFSPRAGESTPQEKMLLEAASRTAAIAIEHRYLTDLLAFQAGHDSLTRLPNRSSFEARLQDAIAHASKHGEQLALFYVDLDRFKDVNDTFGHCGGDALLRQVATRLRRCIRHTDMLARIGGDEFSLLLAGLRDTSEANRLAEVILRAFQTPFTIAGWPVHVTSSIGISFYPEDGLDAPTLQRNSDTAMYRVKKTGKNSFRCFAGDSYSGAELVASSERMQ